MDKIIGTLKVILLAKQKGIIPKVKPTIEQLLRSDFRLHNSILDQIINENSSKIFHKIYIDKKKDKSYLLRVFITEDPKRIIISSVYRTSKIKKYWREEL